MNFLTWRNHRNAQIRIKESFSELRGVRDDHHHLWNKYSGTLMIVPHVLICSQMQMMISFHCDIIRGRSTDKRFIARYIYTHEMRAPQTYVHTYGPLRAPPPPPSPQGGTTNCSPARPRSCFFPGAYTKFLQHNIYIMQRTSPRDQTH